MTADQVSKLTAYNIWVNILDESVWMVLSWSFTAGDRWGKFDLTCTYLKLILFFYDHNIIYNNLLSKLQYVVQQ